MVADLQTVVGDLRGVEFEIHAGSAYRDFGLVDGLRQLGARVVMPAEGLNQGQQLAFYQHDSMPPRSTGT